MWDFISDPPIWFWVVMIGGLVALVAIMIFLRMRPKDEDE